MHSSIVTLSCDDHVSRCFYSSAAFNEPLLSALMRAGVAALANCSKLLFLPCACFVLAGLVAEAWDAEAVGDIWKRHGWRLYLLLIVRGGCCFKDGGK
jgi:ferredoxin